MAINIHIPNIYLKQLNELHKFPFSTDIAIEIIKYDKSEVVICEFEFVIKEINASKELAEFSKIIRSELTSVLGYIYENQTWRQAACECQTIIFGYKDFKLLEMNNQQASNSMIMIVNM